MASRIGFGMFQTSWLSGSSMNGGGKSGVMHVSKTGLIASGAYLAIGAALYIDAYMHPSGLGYEYIPVMFWSFPWFHLFPDFTAICLGLPLNAILIFCVVWICQQIRKDISK